MSQQLSLSQIFKTMLTSWKRKLLKLIQVPQHSVIFETRASFSYPMAFPNVKERGFMLIRFGYYFTKFTKTLISLVYFKAVPMSLKTCTMESGISLSKLKTFSYVYCSTLFVLNGQCHSRMLCIVKVMSMLGLNKISYK